jgi:hypothetical protein
VTEDVEEEEKQDEQSRPRSFRPWEWMPLPVAWVL